MSLKVKNCVRSIKKKFKDVNGKLVFWYKTLNQLFRNSRLSLSREK